MLDLGGEPEYSRVLARVVMVNGWCVWVMQLGSSLGMLELASDFLPCPAAAGIGSRGVVMPKHVCPFQGERPTCTKAHQGAPAVSVQTKKTQDPPKGARSPKTCSLVHA
eukprot:363384-Chlamydomonas_euryale.AAC.18